MPLPDAVPQVNKRVVNPVLRHLAGHGPFVEMEHVGRRSGVTYRTPLMAFRSGPTVTIALTYGPDVDWLRNVRAAAGGRMHLGRQLLTLGAPADLAEDEGLQRMPVGPRQLLPVLGCHDFIELSVIAERPWRGGAAPS
jgi:deazaflavin-dependent oxidoreductase (nitroreductase family)